MDQLLSISYDQISHVIAWLYNLFLEQHDPCAIGSFLTLAELHLTAQNKSKMTVSWNLCDLFVLQIVRDLASTPTGCAASWGPEWKKVIVTTPANCQLLMMMPVFHLETAASDIIEKYIQFYFFIITNSRRYCFM